MSTDLDERLLTERLHRLAAHPGPADLAGLAAHPADDVRRGRTRLRRTRWAAAGGATAAVAALSTGVLALAGTGGLGTTTPDREAPAPVAAPPAPREQPRLPQEVRVPEAAQGGLAAALREAPGARDDWADDLAAMGAVLDGQVVDVMQLGIGDLPSWQGAGVADCPDTWTCDDVQVAGASKARSATRGPVTQLVAEFPEHVLTVAVSTGDFGAGFAWR